MEEPIDEVKQEAFMMYATTSMDAMAEMTLLLPYSMDRTREELKVAIGDLYIAKILWAKKCREAREKDQPTNSK